MTFFEDYVKMEGWIWIQRPPSTRTFGLPTPHMAAATYICPEIGDLPDINFPFHVNGNPGKHHFWRI